jgi:glucosamine-phosphate N-acetyltransferase
MAADSDALFEAHLLSPEVSAVLPAGYRLRALRRTDFDSGFLDCLRVLTTVGDLTEEGFQKQYDHMVRQQCYYLIVIEDTARTEKAVVATGALIVEEKLYVHNQQTLRPPFNCQGSCWPRWNDSIHNCGRVGHIEDIAVAKDQQGKKLGLRLIQALDYIAAQIGCYKSILDCSEANEGFYIKCGFRRAGLQMAHYYEGSKSKSQ